MANFVSEAFMLYPI